MSTAIPFIRSSEITTFKRCPARWWWGWREGLRPRQEQLGPLWFGTGVHLALAAWYSGPGTKRGIEPAETWQEFSAGALSYVKTLFDTGDEERIAKYEDAASLGLKMLEGYRALYGMDDHIEVISPERNFSLDLPWPKQDIWDVRSGDPMARLAGTFDLVYRDLRTERIWLKEHKTARAISTGHLSLDDQAGRYWAVANTVLQREGVLGSKEFIAGILYNFLRKGLPDDRPQDADGYYCNKPVKADYVAALSSPSGDLPQGLSRLTLAKLADLAASRGVVVLGERSKVQPQPLFVRHHVHRTSAERRAQLLRSQHDAMTMELYRDGVLPITKTPAYDCHRFCQFFSICELQERGGDWEALRDVAFRSEDPYADHRKSTDE